TTPQQLVAQQVQQALAQQRPLPQLLQMLPGQLNTLLSEASPATGAQPQATVTATTPSAIEQQLPLLLKRLLTSVTPQQLGSPAQLREALQNSGHFFEQKLQMLVAQQQQERSPQPPRMTTAALPAESAAARLSQQLQGDFKANLLALIALLKAAGVTSVPNATANSAPATTVTNASATSATVTSSASAGSTITAAASPSAVTTAVVGGATAVATASAATVASVATAAAGATAVVTIAASLSPAASAPASAPASSSPIPTPVTPAPSLSNSPPLSTSAQSPSHPPSQLPSEYTRQSLQQGGLSPTAAANSAATSPVALATAAPVKPSPATGAPSLSPALATTPLATAAALSPESGRAAQTPATVAAPGEAIKPGELMRQQTVRAYSQMQPAITPQTASSSTSPALSPMPVNLGSLASSVGEPLARAAITTLSSFTPQAAISAAAEALAQGSVQSTQATVVAGNTTLAPLLQQLRNLFSRSGTTTPLPITADTANSTSASSPELHALMKSAEGGLARVRLNQLASSRQDRQEQVMFVEIPVQTDAGERVMPIEIGRSAPRRGVMEPPGWRVTLHLDDATHGAVKIEIILKGEQISTRFDCSEESTRERLQTQMGDLKQRLQRSGFSIGTLLALQRPGMVQNATTASAAEAPWQSAWLQSLEGAVKAEV
ncbi:MAG: flagellar hook-length control protein FliK, partial [Gammaproteobacteria bacterium]|nr:flagellar hook-length control protein FliK [Gammaproteobacteria bacterium]